MDDSEILNAVAFSNVEAIDLSGAGAIAADFKASQLSRKALIISGAGGDDSIEINETLAIDTLTIDLSQLVIDSVNVKTITIDGAKVSAAFGASAAQTFTGSSVADLYTGNQGNDIISTGAGDDVVIGGAGDDTVTLGEGADTVTIGAGKDTVILTETTAAADTLIWSTAFAAGNANAATVTGFAFGAGIDVIDIDVNVLNGTTTTTSTLTTLAPVAVASNGAATANDVIFTFNGAGDILAAGTTAATAVANAVTALTSGADFAAANITANDSLILQMNDGTNTFVFHYVADGSVVTTTADDIALIGVFNGTTTQALVGDFI